MKQTIKLKESQLRGIIKESVEKLLQEGPGAGYTVEISGLNATNIRLTGKSTKGSDGEIIMFTAEIVPGMVEWKAEGYYDSVSSAGIYYDGELLEEYGTEEKSVQGGKIQGYIYAQDVIDYSNGYGDNEEDLYKSYIAEHLHNFTVKQMVGGGYVHSNLFNPITFENVEAEVKDTYYGAETVYFNEISINAEGIVQAINWFFENCDNLEEIFFGSEEETTPEQEGPVRLNESQLRAIIKESLNGILDGQKQKVDQIVKKLNELNFEKRGHQISVYDDEYPIQIGVTNMNVPATADCQMIAREFGCEFYVDHSWDVGVFEVE